MSMTLGAAVGGAATAAGGNLLNSVMNSAMGWYYAKKAAALQYKYQEKLAKNQPSWSVSGLEKAGLNPMLATNAQHTGGLNVTAPTGGSSGMNLLDGVNAAAQIEDTKADAEKKDAETDLIEEQTKGQEIENEHKEDIKELTKAQKDYYQSLTDKTFKEGLNIDYTNIVKAFEAVGYQNLIKKNPNAILEALEGKYGADAQANARAISEIAKNWGSTAHSAASSVKAIGDTVKGFLGKHGDIFKKAMKEFPGKKK